MHRAWLCAGALALSAVSLAVAEPLAPPTLSEPFAAVFKVRAVEASGRINRGSAVLIAPGKLATTCHVTRAAQSIQLSQADMTWSARSYFADIRHDLCILSAPELVRFAPAVIGLPNGLKAGDKVIAAGYPVGGKLAVASGNVKALHPYDGAPVLQVSAPFDHGQSGGALFDAEGRLVGITAFKVVAGGDFHFALPLQWLPESVLSGDAIVEGGQETRDKAFWERAHGDQPLFLRAASLEAAGKWDALYDVAREWVSVDQANPASWRALGRAFARLKHANDGTEADRRAAPLAQFAANRR
jgi:hypothetical protein